MGTTTTINRERFADLVRSARAIPLERFDMSTWWVVLDCGTVACLCGHYAATMPDQYEPGDWFVNRKSDGRIMDLVAWAEHFGISEDDAERLFDPDSFKGFGPVSKERAVARLEAFARDHGIYVPAEAA